MPVKCEWCNETVTALDINMYGNHENCSKEPLTLDSILERFDKHDIEADASAWEITCKILNNTRLSVMNKIQLLYSFKDSFEKEETE